MSECNISPVYQTAQNDCALACLAMILQHLGNEFSLYELKLHNQISSAGLSIKDFRLIAQDYQLDSKVFKINTDDIEALSTIELPMVAFYDANHFVVVEQITPSKVVMLDPKRGKLNITMDEFLARWSKVAIYFKPNAQFKPIAKPSLLASYIPSFKDFGAIWLGIIALSIVTMAFTWAIPFTISRTLVYYQQHQSLKYSFEHMLLIGIGAAASYFLFCWCKERLLLSIRLKMDQWLSERFVDGILHLPTMFFSRFPLGDLLQRSFSVAAIRDFVSGRLAGTLIDLVLLVGMMAVLTYTSIKVALIFLLVALFVSVVARSHWSRLKTLYRDELTSQAHSSEILSDTILGMNEIKSASKELHFFKRWQSGFLNHLTAKKNIGLLNVKLNSIVQSLATLVPLMVFFLCILLVHRSEMNLADATMAYLITQFGLGALLGLFTLILQVQQLVVHTERVNGIEDFVQRESGKTETDPLLSIDQINIDNAHFSYTTNGQDVLVNVNLSIAGNGIVALTGVSGSGKSTLLSLLSGKVQPHSGGVHYYHQNQRIPPGCESDMACVIQNNYLFKGSIFDNISLFDPSVTLAEVKRMAIIANIDDEITSMPMGYNTILERDGQNVSGGQRQRITLARALIKSPKVLLLDEFTSNLDQANEQKIIENLRDMPCLVIIATHRLSFLHNNDRVIHVDAGTVTMSYHQQAKELACV